MPDTPVCIATQVTIPLEKWGDALFYSFVGFPAATEHFAVQWGNTLAQVPLVRLHSECITGDLFGSLRCDCGRQLEEALQRLTHKGGLLLYLKQEGRGIGLSAKLQAYALQDTGLDTFEANKELNHPEDARDYACAAAMLKALGVQRIHLITNNPEKTQQLRQYGIDIEAVLPTGLYPTEHNVNYLRAKARKGHQLTIPPCPRNAREES
jgi:GTP cyclohydrolase II